MTLKMVAIGILVLMGLSSVMSPKTFRVFLGAFGAICMALFWGLVVTGNHGDEGERKRPVIIAKVQDLLGLQRDWLETATSKSKRLLKDFKENRNDDPSIRDLILDDGRKTPQVKIKRKFTKVFEETPTQIDVIASLQAHINKFLADYQELNPTDVGVDLLQHKDLSPEPLKAVLVRTSTGTVLRSYFTQEYADYVKLRGRQVLTKQRLISLLYCGGAVAALLMILLAGLKIWNRRVEPLHDRDYLRHSDISLV